MGLKFTGIFAMVMYDLSVIAPTIYGCANCEGQPVRMPCYFSGIDFHVDVADCTIRIVRHVVKHR